MTNRGRVVERRLEMTRDKVMSMGVSISALCATDAGEQAASGGQVQSAAAQEREEEEEEARDSAAAAVLTSAIGGASNGNSGGGLLGSGGAVRHGSEFRLLLREIRAEGRAGDWEPES